MKAILFLLTFSFSFLSFQTVPENISDLRKLMPGTWVYQASRTDTSFVKVETGTPLLAYRMYFNKCDDSIEIALMPMIVKQSRRESVFSNISSKWYKKDGSLIDTYYPVTYDDQKNRKPYYVMQYGKKLKNDYYIEGLNSDTLVITNGKVYTVDSVNYSNLKHIYTRQR